MDELAGCKTPLFQTGRLGRRQIPPSVLQKCPLSGKTELQPLLNAANA